MNYFIQFILIITFITFAKTDFIYSCTENKTIALTVKYIIIIYIIYNYIIRIIFL